MHISGAEFSSSMTSCRALTILEYHIRDRQKYTLCSTKAMFQYLDLIIQLLPTTDTDKYESSKCLLVLYSLMLTQHPSLIVLCLLLTTFSSSTTATVFANGNSTQKSAGICIQNIVNLGVFLGLSSITTCTPPYLPPPSTSSG